MKDNDIKHIHELSFWAGKAKKEGTLLNHTYEQFYVSDFDISLEEYEGKKILDIGCGGGRNIERFAAQISDAGRVVGIDYSEVSVEKSAELNKEAIDAGIVNSTSRPASTATVPVW